MPYLILPSRRKRQPQTVARLNPALEFAGFWLPSIGTINLVNSESGTLNGGATIQPRAGGKALRLNGTGNTVTLIPTSSTLLPTTQGVTFVFSGKVLTTLANGDWGILNSGAPVGERCGCHFPFTDGTVYFDYGGATNGSTRVQVAGLTFAESDVFVFSVGARGMEIWQNGALRASNGANPSRSASSSGWGLGGNNSDGGSASPNAVWTAVGMTRRQLRSDICAQLSSDLWGTAFVPDARRIYFDAGAGGDTYSLTASNLTGGTPLLQSATLTQNHGLTASNLAGAAATTQSPALTQNHVVTASNLTGAAATLGTPALTLAGTFVADDLTGAAPVLGTPTLTQQHSLTVTALTGAAATLGTPAMTQNHVVAASSLTSAAPVLGAPTVVLGGTIVADNILAATPLLGAPALTQQHSLTATPLLGASAILGSPAFGQQHLLTGSNIVGSVPTLGTPDLTSGSSGGTGATAEEVAAAVLAALNATAIPVDVRKVNNTSVTGVGSDGDPWRAA